jgi:hypothetical protein
MTAERTRNPPRMPPTIPPIAPEESDELEFTGAAICVDVEGPPELLNEAMDVGKNVETIVEEELAVVDDSDVIVDEVIATVVGMMIGGTTDVIVGPGWVVVMITGGMLVPGPCEVVVTGTCGLVWGIAGRLRLPVS